MSTRRARVGSVYCLQEFDVALHHNVVVKRTKRLVVLMALDSPVDLFAGDASDTAALRQYLRQYTYVDFAAHDWLDRLLYALPLRGMDRRERDDDATRAPTQPTLDFEDADEPDPHNLPGCCCCRRRRRWQLLP